MKKLILVTACAACFAITSYAQQDTTSRRSSQQQPQSQQQSQQQSDQLRNPDMKGWTQVSQDQVPSELRTTLGGTQYRGWESGTIYKNEAGDMYMLRTNDATNPKTFYFDKNGKATTKKPNNRDNN